MLLHFTKMHGAGNDFVVLDATVAPFNLTREQIAHIADRRFGVGCDQLLVVEPSKVPDVDFKYRIFNANGGEVEQCGNGSRCFAVFVRERGLSTKAVVVVETLGGILSLQILSDGAVTVNLGVPKLGVAQVPFLNAGLRATKLRDALLWPIEIADGSRDVVTLSMGNPQAVQIVADAELAPVLEEGALIERHTRFPQGVNAGFMEIVGRNSIRLRVYERGAGETLACGSGACAAVVAGILQGKLASPVAVSMRGGDLSIAWGGIGQPVLLTGPAVTVYEGTITL